MPDLDHLEGHVWVATDLDLDDGGRAWMSVHTHIGPAKQACEDHYAAEYDANHGHEPPAQLDWRYLDEPWMFPQRTWNAAYPGETGRFYDIRLMEVNA